MSLMRSPGHVHALSSSLALALALALLVAAPSSAHAATPNQLSVAPSTVDENEPPGTVVGTFTTFDADLPGDSFTYVLVTNPGDFFAIVGDQLVTAKTLDYEAGAQRSVTVRVTDSTGGYLEKSLTIGVDDANDPPKSVRLSTSGVPEDTPVFGLVGSVSAFGDQDQDDDWTFILVDDGDGRFVLEGDQLRVAADLDYETAPDAEITVEVIDAGGLSAESDIGLSIYDRNEAPTDIALAGGLVFEDAPLGTTVGSLSALGDPDAGDGHTFRIVTADGPFIIDGTAVKTAGALDYETKKTYTPVVRATDHAGRYVEVGVTIQVANTNEAPTGATLSNASVLEGAPSGTTVGNLSAIDPDVGDSHSFALLVGGDTFNLVGGKLTTKKVLDYEATSSVDIVVRVTDADDLDTEVELTVDVTNRNEAPTGIQLSATTLSESTAANAVAAFVTVTDPDANDEHQLLLLQDGNGAFRLENSILRVGSGLDFETAPTLNVIVRARDKGGLFIDVPFVITVTDVDEPATGLAVEPSSVRENQSVGTLVGTLKPLGDPDSSSGYTWSLVQNPGTAFSINGNRLLTAKVLDYETTRTVQIRVRAVPPAGGTPFEQNVTIEVSDEPEAPYGINVSGNVVQEARNEGTFVATLSVTGDPDGNDQHTFSLVQNPDSAFVLQGSTLMTAKMLDFEKRATYPLVVRATDRSGLSIVADVEVRVLDVNETPTGVALSSREIAENAAPNSVVGTVTPVGDPDAVDAYTYTLTQNPDDRFELVGDTLVARAPFDFEGDDDGYRVTVRVRDQGGLSAESSFLVVVTDVNEAPAAITLDGQTVVENAPAGMVVGTVGGGVDPDDGDVGTLSVISDSLGDAFAVDADRRLVTTRALDFETAASASVTLRQTDAGGLFVEGTWAITIEDADEPPTGVALDASTVLESAPIGTVIGHLTVLGDPDAGDTHTLAIDEDDDGKFRVEGDALVLADRLDFETKAAHDVTVIAIDTRGLSATTTFTITVLDDNDPPVSQRNELALPGIDEDEKNPPPINMGAIVGGLGIADPEGDALSLRVVSAEVTPSTGDDGGRWQVAAADAWEFLVPGDVLAADARVRFLPAPDYNGTVTLVLEPFDGTSAGVAVHVTLTVAAINDAPHHELPGVEVDAWQQAPLDVTAAIGGPIAIVDVDATTLELSLTTTHGTLALPTANVTIIEGGVGTPSITLVGEIARLEAALTGLVFTPDDRFVGRTEIVIASDDRGATGAGGAKTARDAIGINVRAAADMRVTIDGEDVATGGTLDLGTIGEGAFVALEIGIENRGDEELALGDGLDASAARAAETLVALRPEADLDAWIVVIPEARVAPANRTRAVLMLRAPSTGPVRLGLAIASNDRGAELYTATLTGRATAAGDLHVLDGERELFSGLSHVVRDVSPGETMRLELRLENTGEARLDLGKTAVLSATNVVVDLEEPFPLLDAGDDDVLVLYLTPTLPGPFTAALELPSTDPDAPVFALSLAGDAVQAAGPRLVIERVPGVLMAPGAVDDVGYGRGGQDVALALRLVNLGGRDQRAPEVTLENEDNCAARTAADAPDVLAPGESLGFSLIVRPDLGGAFAVDVVIGEARWTVTGDALAGSEDVPEDALRLYRWGGGRVAVEDLLGPVDAGVPFIAAWSIANDGPDRVELALPVAVSALDNVDALPLSQPEVALPANRAHLVALQIEALEEGPLSFDLAAAGAAPLRVSSDGQVGVLTLESDAGVTLAANSIVTLPLQKVGKDLVIELFAENAGSGPLTLGQPRLEGGEACLEARVPSSVVLAPGERASFTVTMRPIVGGFECLLVVPSDDPARDEYALAFRARGARGDKGGCAAADSDGSPALYALGALVVAFVCLRRRVRRATP